MYYFRNIITYCFNQIQISIVLPTEVDVTNAGHLPERSGVQLCRHMRYRLRQTM